jgi:hypothetical protein
MLAGRFAGVPTAGRQAPRDPAGGPTQPAVQVARVLERI